MSLYLAKRIWYISLRLHRKLTSPIRMMPDFLIIGAQKCGTTSLYRYLERHPNIAPAAVKEIHFFDLNFWRGPLWYRAYFPSYIHKYYARLLRQQDFVTGEASPYYIFHPHTPGRVYRTTPSIKLILMLRNPVDRAYSHYQHEVRWGFEDTSTFSDAIAKEEQRLAGEKEKMLADENYCSFNHRHYSYLSRGIYIDQIKVWLNFFSAKQLFILKSEDFYASTKKIFKRVLEFLNLPDWEPEKYRNYNYNPTANPGMDPRIRSQLVAYFKLYNQRLYEYLGMDLGWDE